MGLINSSQCGVHASASSAFLFLPSAIAISLLTNRCRRSGVDPTRGKPQLPGSLLPKANRQRQPPGTCLAARQITRQRPLPLRFRVLVRVPAFYGKVGSCIFDGCGSGSAFVGAVACLLGSVVLIGGTATCEQMGNGQGR
jgi:hypothetical protein